MKGQKKSEFISRFNLGKKVALVTGARGLLGYQHCHALLELGASVVLTDIDEHGLKISKERLENDFPGCSILSCFMDVASEDSIIEAKSRISREFGLVDILINNAAIDPKVDAKSGPKASRVENLSLDSWNLQISIGLTGAFLCSKHFGAEMAANTGGVIVNIASDLSVIAPDQRLYREKGVAEDMQPVKPVTYSVIKSGLVGMTRYFATYWNDYDVRVNALSPGGVFNGQNDQFVSEVASRIPLGRMARADEYKSAIQYLVSDASSYMTGHNLVVDGGRSVW